MKLDFNMDKSRVLHRKGSQAAKRHVLQTWAMPEVNSNTVNDWNIFTKISMSMSSHLLLTVPHSSISRNSIASQQKKNLQKPKKQKGNREKPQEFKNQSQKSNLFNSKNTKNPQFKYKRSTRKDLDSPPRASTMILSRSQHSKYYLKINNLWSSTIQNRSGFCRNIKGSKQKKVTANTWEIETSNVRFLPDSRGQ